MEGEGEKNDLDLDDHMDAIAGGSGRDVVGPDVPAGRCPSGSALFVIKPWVALMDPRVDSQESY
jgi:hypothetical protein